MRVLVAEEDADARRQVQKVVEGLGHACFLADAGDQALAVVQEFGPETVILGHGLRGSELPSLIREVRASEDGRRAAIVVVVDSASEGSLEALVAAGADDFLLRPIDPGTLRARFLVLGKVAQLRQVVAEHQLEIDRLTKEADDGRKDPLTRVGNRRRLREDLETLCERAVRYGHTFVVGVYNIDHFRAYNTRCGQAAGDEALRAVARTLANHGRGGDTAYRSGGAEFAVVLPEQSLDRAMIGLERRRRALERLAIPHPDPAALGLLTVSGGAAAFRAGAADPAEGVLERARQALYRAQQAGRNRVEADAG